MKFKWIILLLMMIIYWDAFALLGSEGELAARYKNGQIRLVPDPAFARDQDWNRLFSDHKERRFGKAVGLYKNLVVSEQGTIFVSNASAWNVYKFSSNGGFIKQFGQKGKKNGLFYRRPEVFTTLPNGDPIVKGWHGGLYLFDGEGQFKYSIKLDYGEQDVVALTDTKIAISGFVVYKGSKNKYRVAIRDLQSGKEQEIVARFKDFAKQHVSVTVKRPIRLKSGEKKDHPFMISTGFHGARLNSYIRKIGKQNLLVGFDDSPELSVFSPEGRLIRKINMEIDRVPISEGDKQKYMESLQKPIKTYINDDKKGEADPEISRKLIEKIKGKRDFFSPFMPYYYYLLVDSDNNILVFPYGNGSAGRLFKVYSETGKFIGDCRMILDDYRMRLNPRSRKLQFHNGSLYGVFEKKDSAGVPIRLLKMDIR